MFEKLNFNKKPQYFIELKDFIYDKNVNKTIMFCVYLIVVVYNLKN